MMNTMLLTPMDLTAGFDEAWDGVNQPTGSKPTGSKQVTSMAGVRDSSNQLSLAQSMDIDVLVSHVIDGVATNQDWEAIEAIARTMPEVWRFLALAQRHEGMLRKSVAHVSELAEAIDLASLFAREDAELASTQLVGTHAARVVRPSEHNTLAAVRHDEGHPHGSFDEDRKVNAAISSLVRARRSRIVRIASSIGGWFVAACLALVAVSGMRGTGNGSGFADADGASEIALNQVNQASLVPAIGEFASALGLTTSDTLRAYIRKGNEEGTVIGELPRKLLMQAEPAHDGKGFDVVYVRQILERARVNNLYRFSQDETGRSMPVPIRQINSPM